MKKRAQQKVKHKPNARHTLNEVLHSLQDLVHNEFAGIGGNDAEIASAKTNAPLSKEEVLNSLKALIGDVADTLPSDDMATVDEIPEPSPTDKTAGKRTKKMQADASDLMEPVSAEAEGAQASDDTESAPPSADAFRLEMEEANESEPETVSQPASNNTGKRSRDYKSESEIHGTGAQVEINWDDIPVLNEVVAPPPPPDNVTTREAREIAIKVAAALNIEVRKKGGKSMDIKTIMRLQSLLSQELHDRRDIDSFDDENQAGETGVKDSDGTKGIAGDDGT